MRSSLFLLLCKRQLQRLQPGFSPLPHQGVLPLQLRDDLLELRNPFLGLSPGLYLRISSRSRFYY